LVNFAQRCSARAVFVHCSSTYGLFCVHGAASWLAGYDRSLAAAAAATDAMNAILSGPHLISRGSMIPNELSRIRSAAVTDFAEIMLGEL